MPNNPPAFPFIAAGTIVGDVTMAPPEWDFEDDGPWYDSVQDEGPDFNFVCECETSDKGRVMAERIASALNAAQAMLTERTRRGGDDDA